MLIVLLYHRIGKGKHANSLEMFRAHLTYLKERYPIVLPGDPLRSGKLSVCLSFDDASFDFYHYVFPLLQEMNIRALLGVPVRYILECTDLSAEERLSVPYTLAMQDGFFDKKAPFCTWSEIEEMVRSGQVEVASHSHMHCNLTFPFVDLEREVVHSKRILEERLPQVVSSFVYPFGRTNPRLHQLVKEHYPYAFRIGSALNRNWGTGEKPLRRVPADNLPSPTAPLSWTRLLKYLSSSLF